MTDIREFLLTQLDREERDANLIPGGGYRPARWTAHRVIDGEWAEIRQHDLPHGAADGEWEEVSTAALVVWGRNEDEHVARWDPARIVAEVAAKRQILAEHDTMWRDIGWLDDERCEVYEELAVCARCVPKHSHFRTRADVPVGPCRTVRILASPYRSEPGFDPAWEVTT